MVALTIAETIPVREIDPDLGQQPVANERTDNTNRDIADKPEASPLHNFSGQPACNKANHQYDQKTFI